MNVSLEKKGNVDGIITVQVEKADYADKVKKELKKIAETHVVPGFRKGHVPMDHLRRRFGKDVKSDVINDLVYREVYKYLQDNKLPVLGEPLPVEMKEVTLDDTDYTFQYEIGMAPDFSLALNKDINLPYYKIAVSDKMREEQDKNLCQRLGAQVPGEAVDERALVKGAIMELNEDGTVKETEDAVQVVNGIIAPFHFTDREQAALFDGKHVNDKVVFNPYKTCNGNAAELSSMLNIDKEQVENHKGDFEMAISEIIVLKPAEHNQEFFDTVFGKDKVHNEEEYQKALTEMIENGLEGNSKQLFAAQAHEYFTEKYKDAELPEEFLKKWLVARNEELTAENIDEEYAKMRPSLIWQLVKDEIAKQCDVKVEEDDLLAFAKQMAFQQFAQYGMTNMDDETITDYAKRMLENKDYRSRIYDTVNDNKLYAAIENAVTLDVKTVSVEEFQKIAQGAPEAEE